MQDERISGRVGRWWRDAALVAFNTAALLVAINAACALFFAIQSRLKHEEVNGDVALLGMDTVARAYPGWNRNDLTAFLRENRGIGSGHWVYEPYTTFRLPAIRGRFINVSPAGYRISGAAQPWPPDGRSFNIFVFGGSTTFGAGVPDGQTFAAYLPSEWNARHPARAVQVYNFGVHAYFSVQERLRFEQLLAAGRKPDLAVFVDGFNDIAFPEPAMTEALTLAVRDIDAPSLVHRAIHFARPLAIARVARSLVPRKKGGGGIDCGPIVSRWSTNKLMTEAVARRFGVRTLFVWQPIPVYRYDLRYDVFGPFTAAMKDYAPCYARMAELRAGFGDDFLWLADIQEGRKENLYVDAAHYTAAFNRDIAKELAKAIQVP
jgi:hypothetical protein